MTFQLYLRKVWKWRFRAIQINNLHQHNTSRAREEADVLKDLRFVRFLTGVAR
jgi:hypothetical protein